METPAAGPPLRGPALMRQWWRDAVFVHWRVDPRRVAALMPPDVRPDTLDGATYVGLVPFRMVGAGLGRGPAVPWLGTFGEVNVRLYSVDRAGRRGVVFLSLEASRLLVVLGARAAFATPYHWARVRVHRRGPEVAEAVRYRTTRRRGGQASRVEVAVGRRVARPSEEDVFLTARFGLHTRLLGTDLYVPNTHTAWPLHRATLTHLDDDLLEAAGVVVSGREPDSVLYSPGVHTAFGLPQR